MRQGALEILCCPACHSTLSLSDAKVKNGNVANGELTCLNCDRNYLIRDAIVHFINLEELEGQNQRFARNYDRLAPFYTIFSKLALLPFGGERKARKEILDRLDLDGGRLLEVSIGNGVNLPYLYNLSPASEIFGIDISIGMLSQCRKMITKRNWQVDLCLAMAEGLPFRAETFDHVLHIGGINFFSNKRQAIEEMIRVVRPGGKIVMADEAERFAKQVDRSVNQSSQNKGDIANDSTIYNLVPSTMQDIRLDGIWKMHGKHHGFCLEFRKP